MLRGWRISFRVIPRLALNFEMSVFDQGLGTFSVHSLTVSTHSVDNTGYGTPGQERWKFRNLSFFGNFLQHLIDPRPATLTGSREEVKNGR